MTRRGRDGLTLVEVLVGTALLATSIVCFSGLSVMETRWTRDLEDHHRGLTLAANLLALLQHGHLDCLDAGVPQSDGSYLVDDALNVVPSAGLALGNDPDADDGEGPLARWVRLRRDSAPGEFSVTLRFVPVGRDAAGHEYPYVGTCHCTVEWTTLAGGTRRVALATVLGR